MTRRAVAFRVWRSCCTAFLALLLFHLGPTKELAQLLLMHVLLLLVCVQACAVPVLCSSSSAAAAAAEPVAGAAA